MQDKELEQLEDLKRRFGYMFETPRQGLDFYRGWLADFISACEQIDALLGADKLGFRFTQAKEKYGWARYYFSTDRANPMRLSLRHARGVHEITTGLEDGHDIEKAIAGILSDAEEKSMRKCVVCGAPAEICDFDGWLICACEMHALAKGSDRFALALLWP